MAEFAEGCSQKMKIVVGELRMRFDVRTDIRAKREVKMHFRSFKSFFGFAEGYRIMVSRRAFRMTQAVVKTGGESQKLLERKSERLVLIGFADATRFLARPSRTSLE